VTLPGLITSTRDVRTTMLEAGDAILRHRMGTGDHARSQRPRRRSSRPLLDTNVEGRPLAAPSITGGTELSLIEASEAAEVVQAAAHPEANIIFGANVDETSRAGLGDRDRDPLRHSYAIATSTSSRRPPAPAPSRRARRPSSPRSISPSTSRGLAPLTPVDPPDSPT